MAAKSGVIVGVGGQIGTAVARAMLANGWSVRGLQRHRSPLPDDLADVELSAGDRNDDDVVAKLVADGADGLVDVLAYNAGHGRQLLAHAGHLGALAVVSSVAVYADADGRSVNDGEPRLPVPVAESQPLVPGAEDTYGGGKVLLEQALLDGARVPTTLLRPAAVCGPRSQHLREWWFVKRVLDGRRVVPLKYGGTSRFHPASTANLAALAVHCLGLTSSQVVNAADPDCPTVAEIAEHVSRSLNHEWELVPLTDEQSTPGSSVGDTPWSASHPIVLDTSRATELGYRPATTYADAVPALVEAALTEVGELDWRDVYPALARYPHDLFGYAAEDRLLDELH